MGIDLSIVWALVIAFGVMMYVVMDGFDLGIGILFPFAPSKGERDIMMNTVAPVWDGNETWLVLGGAGLYAAFPLAYSVILSALYLPIMLMLLGLVFRGVAFEFRFKARDHKRHIWDKAFIGGSLVATFFQGVILGTYIAGIPVRGRAFAGGAFDWMAPFPLFTGAALVVTYALLGATWLIMKTEGTLQHKMRGIGRVLVALLLLCIGVVSVWTPLLKETIATRWFSFQNLWWFLPVPVLVLAITAGLFISTRKDDDTSPFLFTLAMIFLGYSGLAISLWPDAVPGALTLWQAAAPPQSQGFALVGALPILPLILGYTAWSYHVFKGKVGHAQTYH